MERKGVHMNREIDKEEKKHHVKRWIALLLLLLIGLAGFCGFLLWRNMQQPHFVDDFSAKKGLLKHMSQKEIQKLLNQEVKDGYVNIYMNSMPVFDNGKAAGNVYIQNIPANKYGFRVRVLLDDNQEKVLETGYIAPGYNIEKMKLDKPLKKGTYPATAIFTCYQNIQAKVPIAESDVKIQLRILK